MRERGLYTDAKDNSESILDPALVSALHHGTRDHNLYTHRTELLGYEMNPGGQAYQQLTYDPKVKLLLAAQARYDHREAVHVRECMEAAWGQSSEFAFDSSQSRRPNQTTARGMRKALKVYQSVSCRLRSALVEWSYRLLTYKHDSATVFRHLSG